MTFDDLPAQEWESPGEQSLAQALVRETMSSEPAPSPTANYGEALSSIHLTRLYHLNIRVHPARWKTVHERGLSNRWFHWSAERQRQPRNTGAGAGASIEISLGIGGEYSPSAELIQYWIDGVKAFQTITKIEDEISTSVTSRSELAAEFSRRLVSLIGSYSQPKRESTRTRFRLTNSGRFTPDFQIAVCERFWILPDQSAAYLARLSRDLVEKLASGVEIEGEWGVLGYNENDLFMELEPLQRVPSTGFQAATRLE